MADARLPIDYLIEALSQDSQQNSSSQNVGVNAQSTVSNSAPTANITRTPTQMTPSTIRRNCRIAKILGSSSLKKRIKKSANCRFCSKFIFSRPQLESHLSQSELCLALYLRDL